MKTKDNGPSPGTGNGGGDKGPTKPGKPGNDPDQTPNREIQDPPVADPGKVQDPDPKQSPSKPAYK